MTNQRWRSLNILSLALATTSGLTAVAIFAVYGLRPAELSDVNVSLTAALLGTIAVVYFVTLHQVLSRRWLSASTLVLTTISAANIALVIISTGGLNSPYYSLWLLAIVIAGLFGIAEVAAVVGLTLAYYAIALISQGAHAPYLHDHLIQLAITLAAGGLAAWVQVRGRQSSGTTVVSTLSSGQLKADAIVANIGEGVMVIDADRKIQLFNPAAQTVTGWDESSALNIDCDLVLQLHTSDDKPLNELTDPFTESWRKQSTIVRDNLVMNSRGGRKTQLSLSVSPLYGTDGKPSGAIVLFRDISREKEVERQKDEFISTASHEMRTPVAAIEGYISLAMNSNVATIDDRAKNYLEKAHTTITHLGDLFRDLLSVTKAEDGQLAAKIEAVNLGALLQAAVDDMQFTAAKKKLTLVYQIGDQGGKAIAPLYYVAANPERLREVIMNLIDNAIKFTAEGGIKVILQGNDKEVAVGVADSGVGIAPEDIPHLFQKFYRIDSSATRTIGGTGLGLYLCRRVIELFNGRVWVESKLGQGSTFCFSLPRLSQDGAERMQAATAATAANSQPAPEPSANQA
jgi:two-component system, OmpR family, sensor histidine kinase VicK